MLEAIRTIREIYGREVLTQRTRTVKLLGRKCTPEIQHTFLGLELKMGRKRLTCPDTVTTRFLKIFAEVGMPQVQIPYDLTRTAALLPRLEEAFRKLKSSVDDRSGKAAQEALRRVYGNLRRELKTATQESGAAPDQIREGTLK